MLRGGATNSLARDDALLGFVDASTHDVEVARRTMRREFNDRAGELATWIGVLQDLAERRVAVAVHIGGGRCHRGYLLAVGRDHLVLVGEGGCTVLVAMAAVGLVRPQPATDRVIPRSDRLPAEGRTLLEALEELLPTDPEVVVGIRTLPETVRGRVVGLGQDVLTLRTADGGVSVVPHLAIADIAWGS